MNTSTLAAFADADLSEPEQRAYWLSKLAELKVLVGLIEATVSQPEERDLVLERLPNGQLAWLRADLTAKNRGPL